MTIKVLLADDHALVRTGFKLLLQASADIEVVAEAESGEEAYRLFVEQHPDVVIMDLAMPGIGGIEAVKKIMARDRNARILALSAHEDLSHPKRVLQAGALGYLSKRGAPEALIDAVRKTAEGRRVIDPALAQKLAVQSLQGNEATPVEQLSEREFAVFIQLAQGASVARIAELLSLSPSTVGTHLYNIKQKLGLANQSE
ncbi:MAG: response regulator transcription factor, partial [Burkholderiales bacterium]